MSAQTPQKHGYYAKVIKAIDAVLREIFGDEATLLIYNYLENCHSLRKDEIVEKIDIFEEGLEEFLMSGAHPIKMKILEDIHLSCGLIPKPTFEKSNTHDFVSQMKTLIQKV